MSAPVYAVDFHRWLREQWLQRNQVEPPKPYRSRTGRRAIPARVRFFVLKRDHFRCRYCGASAPHVRLVVDHVRPLAKGGTNDPENLCTACEACNQGKSDCVLDCPKP